MGEMNYIAVYHRFFKQAAEELDVKWDILAGIAELESGGNPYAIRHEKNYRYLVGLNGGAVEADGVRGIKPCSNDTELYAQKTSWGLMQVMGGTARWLGFTEPFLSSLLEPERNIFFGALYLRRQLHRYINEERAIAAYNTGRVIYAPGGAIANQDYVDKVLAASTRWRNWEQKRGRGGLDNNQGKEAMVASQPALAEKKETKMIGKIFGILTTVLGEAGKIIDLIEKLVPQIKPWTNKVQEWVDGGEELADDMIDRNRDEITDVRDFFAAMELAGAQGKEMCQCALDAAADYDDTPDRVTLEEVRDFQHEATDFYNALAKWWGTVQGAKKGAAVLAASAVDKDE